MALPQKKRFTFFGSPPLSPILSPTKSSTLLSNYFSSQEKQQDKLPNVDDVRKAIDNLERLVIAADAYRDLLNKLSKASKTFCKTLKDYGNCKGMENVHVMCFQTTSQFYDNHTDIQSKLNKALQKDFEAIQKFWDKYSKKVAKDEKAHNDYIGDLDKQLKKMSKDYEKKTKKDNKASLESHNQYMTSFTAVGSDIARAQKEYAEKVAKREKQTHSVVSQIVCRLTEGQFAYFNESLKKCGPSITKMKEWAPFAGEDMPPPQDLDSFLGDQAPQSQSDRNSIISERKSVSIASISEKQVAAMNFPSQESRIQFNEEPEDIISTKFVQIPEPKFPMITTPETAEQIHARSNLFTLDINNKKNDENTCNSSSTTSSIPSTPVVQPTPAFPIYTTTPASPIQPFSAKSFSKFSIGIRDSDDVFLRDEKEVHTPEVFMDSKVEKSLLNQNFNNQFKIQEEKVNESQNVTSDVKKSNENDEEDDEKDTKTQNDQPEEKGIHDRDSVSNDSNSTLNDYKKDNEKSIGELKIDEKNEPPPSEESNENNGTKNSTIEDETIKNEEKGITNEKNLSIDKIDKIVKDFKPNLNLNINDDDSLNESANQSLSQTPSENPKSIPGEFPFKNKEIPTNNSSPRIPANNLPPRIPANNSPPRIPANNSPPRIPANNSPSRIPANNLPPRIPENNSPPRILANNSPPRSPVQTTKQMEYSRDDGDYRKEYSRKYEEDIEYYQTNQGLYNNEIRANEMNRYTNRDIIRRDEELLYNPSFRGERMRYNDKNLNYHRTQQYVVDDYESYDYSPSQNHGSYATRDRSPPRTSISYSQRSYSNNIPPVPISRGSSVREITSRFQSMNEDRRSISPSARNIPMPIPGRVSEISSRFDDRTNRNDPPRIRGGGDYRYENGDNRYNEPIEYRSDRYIQYDDLHDGITPVHHCNCHNCQTAENTIHRLSSRHNNPAPFNLRKR